MFVGRLNEQLARVYTSELVMALKSMQERFVMHRDLKPENVMIDANLHLKIVSTKFWKYN